MLNRPFAKLYGSCAWIGIFCLSFWLNINPEWAAKQIESQINKKVSPLRIHIQTLSTGFTGLDLESLVFKDPKNEAQLVLTDLSISLAPWHLLQGELGLQAKMYQGIIEGSLSLTGHLILNAQGIQPNQNLWMRKQQWIQSNPVLSTYADLYLFGEPKGSIDAQINDLSLSGQKTNTHLMIDLPTTNIKSAKVQLKLQGQSFQVQSEIQGDLSGKIGGTLIYRHEQPELSQVHLKIKGSVSDSYKKQLGFFASLLQGYSNNEGQISVEVTGPLLGVQLKRI